MTPADLLATARALGATVELDLNGLVVRRVSALPQELRLLFTEHKAALTELLRREAAPTNNIDDKPRITGGASLMRCTTVTTTSSALATVADRVAQAGVPIGLALDTTGPDPLLHSPALLALALPDAQYVVDLRSTAGLGPLADALRGAKVVGHGLQNTLAFLSHHFDVMPAVEADAEIYSKLLGGGANLKTDEHSLDALARTHLRVDLPTAPGTDAITSNAAGIATVLAVRVGVLSELINHLGDRIKRDNLHVADLLERNVLPSIVRTSLGGVGLDADRLRAIVADREAEMAWLESVLLGALGDVNLDDDTAVLGALQDYGLPVEASGKDALAHHLDDHVAQALTKYRHLRAFVRHAAPPMLANAAQYLDGRVRPRIDPLGAATGRISYTGANLQGVEKGDAVRGCCVPAPGHVFVVGDYSAIDLRILAHRAQDRALIEAFRSGVDLHRARAARLAGKAPELVDEHERSAAKQVNFGPVYGMGPESLARTLFLRAKRVVSVVEAARMLDDFRREHVGVAAWQDRIRLRRDTELRTASGRIRRFAPTDSIARRLNASIQGTVADGLKIALIRLQSVLPRYARIVLTVHDEIVVEVSREYAAEIKTALRREMIEGMSRCVTATREFPLSVPIDAEVSVRKTWAKGSIISP